MKRGREVAEELGKVEADPRLKSILAEMAYNIYELYKQQSEIVTTLNMLIESHAKIVNGIGNQMNFVMNKMHIVDEKEEQLKDK